MQPIESVDKKTSFSINPSSGFSSLESSPVSSISFPIISLESQSLHPLSEQLITPFITDSLHLNRAGMDIIEEVNEVATSVIGSHSRLYSLQQVTADSVGWNVHLSQQIGNRHYETAMQGGELIAAHASLAQKIRKGENDLKHQTETQKLQVKKIALEVEQEEIELERKKIELAQKQRESLKNMQIISLKASLGKRFTKRSDLLKKLEDTLLPKVDSKRHDPTIWLVLWGLGGIGKSELACYFANEYEKCYSLIWWINSETADNRAYAYRQLANELNIRIDQKATSKEIEKKLFFQLENHPFNKPWLLIYDNAEEEYQYDQLEKVDKIKRIAFPQRGGFILMTARSNKMAPFLEDCLEVNPFTPLEGLEFLKARLSTHLPKPLKEYEKHQQEEKELPLKSLINQLHGYPLALNQAAAYIIENKMLVTDFLQALGQKKEISREIIQKIDVERYGSSLKAVWCLTFKNLLTRYPLALKWLHLCSYLDPTGIPLEWMEWWVKKEDKPSEKQKAQEVVKLLNALESYALVHYDIHTKQLSLHRLVQEVIRSAALFQNEEAEVKGEETNFVHQAYQLLLEKGNEIEIGTPEIWELALKWLGHAEYMLQHFAEVLTQGAQGQLWSQIGHAKRIIVDYQGALVSHQKALHCFQAEYEGKSHPDIACSLHSVGQVLRWLGRLKEAKEHYKQTLHMLRDLYGTQSHPHVAISLNNLGITLQALGFLKKAKNYYEQSQQMHLVLGGDNSNFEVGASLHNLGVVLQEMGQLEQAKQHYNQALQIYDELYGTQPHPNVAISLNNLGTVLSTLQQFEEAKQAFRKGMEIQEALYGKRPHPSQADSLNNLGLLLAEIGEVNEAEENFRKALEMQRSFYKDENHPSIALLLFNLGDVLRKQGKFTLALPYLEENLKMRRHLHGNKACPKLASALATLGTVLISLQQGNQAKACIKEALGMQYAIDGDQPSNALAAVLTNMGAVMRLLKEREAAKPYFEKALQIYRLNYAILPSFELANAWYNLGIILEDLKEVEAAEQHYRESLKIRRSLYNLKPHPDVAASLRAVGGALKDLRQFEQAKQHFQEELEIQRALHPTQSHEGVANSLFNLSILFVDLKKYDLAKKHMEEALTIYQQLHAIEEKEDAQKMLKHINLRIITIKASKERELNKLKKQSKNKKEICLLM
ncbi:hypothetical protein NEOC84_000204|uniref:tetratricopeptide repeat protein n=1 Tax=Neochlamydia sp. AcF84 TaxID=2315858 RepID=UPI00140B665A|nr:tetratricopeptide repeat protein [Neochlamydia sp. AcF84]NGY94340.1 hypothetical protein [Neochlamydia sp. AcF84]